MACRTTVSIDVAKIREMIHVLHKNYITLEELIGDAEEQGIIEDEDIDEMNNDLGELIEMETYLSNLIGA